MKRIFTFGSNESGRHGKGAALHAFKHHGAKYGSHLGLTGDSYAIPTKDERLQTLPLYQINQYVALFIGAAHEECNDMEFYVTAIGCGLAGYRSEDIAPMFRLVPQNCLMPIEWREWLPNTARYHNEPCCGAEI